MFTVVLEILTVFLEELKAQSKSSLSDSIQSTETLIALLQNSVLKNVPTMYLPQSIMGILQDFKKIQKAHSKSLDQNWLTEELVLHGLRLIGDLSQEISTIQDSCLSIFDEIKSVQDISSWKGFINLVLEPSKTLIIAWYFDRDLIFHLVNCCLSEEESKVKVFLELLFNGLKWLSPTGQKNVCYGEVLLSLYQEDDYVINPFIHALIHDLLVSEADIFTPEIQEGFSRAILDFDDLFMALALTFHTLPRQERLKIDVHELFKRLLDKAVQPSMLAWHRILANHERVLIDNVALLEQFDVIFPVSKHEIHLENSDNLQDCCRFLEELFSLYHKHINTNLANFHLINLSQVLSKVNNFIERLDRALFIDFLSTIKTFKVESAPVFLSALILSNNFQCFFTAIYLRSISKKKAIDILSGSLLFLAEKKPFKVITGALSNLDHNVEPYLKELDMGDTATQRILLLILLLATREDMQDRGYIEFPERWMSLFSFIMKKKFLDPMSALNPTSGDLVQQHFGEFFSLIKNSRYIEYLPPNYRRRFIDAIRPVYFSDYEQRMKNLLMEEEIEQQPHPVIKSNGKIKKNKKNATATATATATTMAEAAEAVDGMPTPLVVNTPPRLDLEVHAANMRDLENPRRFCVIESTADTPSEESGLMLSPDSRGSECISVVSMQTNHSLLDPILEPIRLKAQQLTASVKDLQKRSIPIAWKKRLNLVIEQLTGIQDLLPALELPALLSMEEISQDATVVIAASADRLQWEKDWGVILGNYCKSVADSLEQLVSAIPSDDKAELLEIGQLIHPRLLSHLELLSRCYFQDPELQIDARFWAIVKKLKTYFEHLQIDFFIKGSYFLRPMDAGDIDVVIAPKNKTSSFFVTCDKLVQQLSMIEISKQSTYKVYRQTDAAVIVNGVMQWKIQVQLEDQQALAFDLNFWHDPLTPQSELAKTVSAWFSACAVHWYPEGYAVMSARAAVANYGGRLAMLKEPTRQEMPDIIGYTLKTVIRFADLDADLWIKNFLAQTIAPATRTVDRALLSAGLKYLFNHFDHRAFLYMQFILEHRLIAEVMPQIGMSAHQYCSDYFNIHFLSNGEANFSSVSAAQFLAMYFFGAVVNQTSKDKQSLFDRLSESLFCVDLVQEALLLLRWMPETTPVMDHTAMWYSWPVNRAAWFAFPSQGQQLTRNLCDIFSLWQRVAPGAETATLPALTARPESAPQPAVVGCIQPALRKQGLFASAAAAPASEGGGKLSSVVARDTTTKLFMPL